MTKHGGKVKFLNFREVLERLEKNLLAGQSLRAVPQGGDNGVRLLDLDQDHYLDVVIGNEQVQKTRVWSAKTNRWVDSEFPGKLIAREMPATITTPAPASAWSGPTARHR